MWEREDLHTHSTVHLSIGATQETRNIDHNQTTWSLQKINSKGTHTMEPTSQLEKGLGEVTLNSGRTSSTNKLHLWVGQFLQSPALYVLGEAVWLRPLQ